MKKIMSILAAGSLIWSCTPKEEPNPFDPKTFASGNKFVTVYTTADSTTLRITKTDTLHFKEFGQPLESEACVFIDPSHQFQTFLGIGGAITDASAEVFAKLPKNKQKEIIMAYYDTLNGIGYSLARTNIHSCDFSSDSYTYVKDNDSALASFSIDHDKPNRFAPA